MCPATCGGQCGGLNTATTTTVSLITTTTIIVTTTTDTTTTTTDTTTTTTDTTTTTTDTTTTTTGTTTTACPDLGCLYGFFWRFDLCTCSCNIDAGSAFTGTICQNVDCTKAVDTDPGLCPLLPCGDPSVQQVCPWTCLVCPNSG